MVKKILASVVIFLTLFIFLLIFGKHSNDKLISPLMREGKMATNLWFPQSGGINDDNIQGITAKAAYFIDTKSGAILYQKNEYQKMPVASLVKIMTVILAVENKDFKDTILISPRAASMEADHMQLKRGEKLTVEELLYGIFLVSANDAAEALAESTTSSREDFISQMNLRAWQLGMKDTLFINPTGLEEESNNQYSTAFDVALMSRYLIKYFPHIIDISKTPEIFLPESKTHQEYTLVSGINLLTTYPGVVGLKTGYTPQAGLTLVTMAEKEGHQVLGVLLNSENRREEARKLLNYSFEKLGIPP